MVVEWWWSRGAYVRIFRHAKRRAEGITDHLPLLTLQEWGFLNMKLSLPPDTSYLPVLSLFVMIGGGLMRELRIGAKSPFLRYSHVLPVYFQ